MCDCWQVRSTFLEGEAGRYSRLLETEQGEEGPSRVTGWLCREWHSPAQGVRAQVERRVYVCDGAVAWN